MVMILEAFLTVIKIVFLILGCGLILAITGFVLYKILCILYNWGYTTFYQIKKYKNNKTYTEEYHNGEPTLTFEQFISFYNISPEKFSCYYNSVHFLSKGCFYFKTYGDLEKYKEWLRNREKSETELKSAKSYEFLTSTIEADIKSKLAEVAKEQEEILLRIKQENNILPPNTRITQK